MTTPLKVRLAFRHEGIWWNAYIAQSETMGGALQIGSILIGAVANNPQRKQEFMDLMQEVMADGVEFAIGARPNAFAVEDAPEAERSGHG